MFRLLALIAATVSVIAIAACGSSSGSLEDRIADLEDRVETLESGPAIGEAIVVGTETERFEGGGQYCVRYAIGSETERTCLPFGTGEAATAAANECAAVVTVGEPLPDECR